MNTRIIHDICRKVFNQTPHTTTRLTGGVASDVIRATLSDKDVVIRMAPNYLATYKKEQWAMQQAAAVDVNVPEIHDIGSHPDTNYMVIEYIPGILGANDTSDKLKLYEAMGRIAKQINSVPVTGYGFNFSSTPSPHFLSTWQDNIARQDKSTFENNRLIELGAITPEQFTLAREFLREMANWSHAPYLSHNVITPVNVIRHDNGNVFMLDWSMAQGQPAPYSDLGRFATWTRDPDLIAAFVRGYGLSVKQYTDILPDVNRVTLGNVLRTTLWADQTTPQNLGRYIDQCKKIVPDLLKA